MPQPLTFSFSEIRGWGNAFNISETILLGKSNSTPRRKLTERTFHALNWRGNIRFHHRCLSADKKTFLVSFPACMIYNLMTHSHYQLINCSRMPKCTLKREHSIHFCLTFDHMKWYVMTHCFIFHYSIFHFLRRDQMYMETNHAHISSFLVHLVPGTVVLEQTFPTMDSQEFSNKFKNPNVGDLIILEGKWFSLVPWFYEIMGYSHGILQL